jgi:hypothetical protein
VLLITEIIRIENTSTNSGHRQISKQRSVADLMDENDFDDIQTLVETLRRNVSTSKFILGFSNAQKIIGVADFRDENDFAYIQYLCRDVPWNVSTPKNHTPIQQRRQFFTPTYLPNISTHRFFDKSDVKMPES